MWPRILLISFAFSYILLNEMDRYLRYCTHFSSFGHSVNELKYNSSNYEHPREGLLLPSSIFQDKNDSSVMFEETKLTRIGWVRPDVVYGHVHMAKTAGTEINGELAMHFERVCGNKGYSYDAVNSQAQ